MSKRTNSPIGEVVCPYKGCTEVCKVYQFRPRSPGALTLDGKPRKTVFSGKHYAECSVHGRIGSDGNPAVTNYILSEGDIWGANGRTVAPEKSREKSAPAQAPAPKTPEPTPRRSSAKAPEPKPQPRRADPEPQKRPWWEPII